MIMINGNWEQVKDLSDALRIVSENIGSEFAQKVEEICGEPNLDLEEQNFMLLNKIENMNNRLNIIKELFMEVLSENINQLSGEEEEKYINKIDSILRGD